MSTGWRIAIDQSRCIGSGLCAGAAPAYFRLEGEHSVPLRAEIEPDDVVRDAAEFCPVEAIQVRDAADNLIAPEP